jgi:two-component system chemotaxis response regulator CheY
MKEKLMQRILIVDDSKVIRLAIRGIVESLGFAAAEAADGQEALDYCHTAGAPDAIILDIIMPVMDGLSFLLAARQDQQLKECIVIVCSTKNSMAELQQAVACGANEYIMKPFTREILEDKLRLVGLLK